jgi:hypothetical protein
MRTLFLIASLLCTALPAAAQSRLYTNADVRQTTVAWTRTPTAEELRGLEVRQFVYVPPASGPRTVILRSAPGDGPFGTFAPKIPDRRLDGSLWTDPPWEQRTYVGYGYHAYGHASQRTGPRDERPRTSR